MSFLNKLKQKFSHKSTKSTEEKKEFTIQPHPAKTNDPADLNGPPATGGGLASNPNDAVHHARDPHVPSADIMNSLEEPAGRDELRARQAELNK